MVNAGVCIDVMWDFPVRLQDLEMHRQCEDNARITCAVTSTTKSSVMMSQKGIGSREVRGSNGSLYLWWFPSGD